MVAFLCQWIITAFAQVTFGWLSEMLETNPRRGIPVRDYVRKEPVKARDIGDEHSLIYLESSADDEETSLENSEEVARSSC